MRLRSLGGVRRDGSWLEQLAIVLCALLLPCSPAGTFTAHHSHRHSAAALEAESADGSMPPLTEEESEWLKQHVPRRALYSTWNFSRWQAHSNLEWPDHIPTFPALSEWCEPRPLPHPRFLSRDRVRAAVHCQVSQVHERGILARIDPSVRCEPSVDVPFFLSLARTPSVLAADAAGRARPDASMGTISMRGVDGYLQVGAARRRSPRTKKNRTRAAATSSRHTTADGPRAMLYTSTHSMPTHASVAAGRRAMHGRRTTLRP